MDKFGADAERLGIGRAESSKLFETLEQMNPASPKALPEPERKRVFDLTRDALGSISGLSIEDQITTIRDNPVLSDRVRALALNELLVRQSKESEFLGG